VARSARGPVLTAGGRGCTHADAGAACCGGGRWGVTFVTGDSVGDHAWLQASCADARRAGALAAMGAGPGAGVLMTRGTSRCSRPCGSPGDARCCYCRCGWRPSRFVAQTRRRVHQADVALVLVDPSSSVSRPNRRPTAAVLRRCRAAAFHPDRGSRLAASSGSREVDAGSKGHAAHRTVCTFDAIATAAQMDPNRRDGLVVAAHYDMGRGFYPP
jgi:hypothetical protein